MKTARLLSLLALAGACAPALAGPPSLILTGQIGGDLTADGRTVFGAVFEPATLKHIVYSYTPGVGITRSGATQDNDVVRCSGDGSAVIWTAYDLENLAGLGTNRYTPHLWRPALGTVTNLGKPSWGSSCDAFATELFDLAAGGRYAVGGGYTNSTCGPYRAQRYDIQTNAWEILPVSTSPPPWNAQAALTRADAVSSDGSVVVGYDENYADASQQRWRGAAVWVRNGSTWTQTILDRYANKAYAVSADGSTIVGKLSAATTQATFGIPDSLPVYWTRSGSSWTPHILSGDDTMQATAVSADGHTIVGSGGDDPGGWIWHLGDETPTGITAYVASLGGSFPGIEFGSAVSPILALSADGNTLLVSTQNSLDCALVWFPSAILSLNGAPCEPASVYLGPVSHFNVNGPVSEPGGMVFNCFATGSWPMTFQWQQETGPGTNVWVDLTDDNCSEYLPDYFNFHGVNTMQLRLGGLDGVWPGRYRCVVTNDCGSATCNPIRAATCYADFDCNGFVNGDDFDSFVVEFEAGSAAADIDGNGFTNGDDFDSFVAAFESGC